MLRSDPEHPHIPPGWPCVVPQLSVTDPEQCVAFLQQVFDTRGDYHSDRPSEMRIGDSLIMVGGTLEREATNPFLYVYVPDTDAAFARAIALGSDVIDNPREMPYGDRRAMV